jgi:hypothetical protein
VVTKGWIKQAHDAAVSSNIARSPYWRERQLRRLNMICLASLDAFYSLIGSFYFPFYMRAYDFYCRT